MSQSRGSLRLLCAGAAQGLVDRLTPQFRESTGMTVDAQFGPVGTMREALVAGEPCDVLIVSHPMMEDLARSGDLRGDTLAPLGRVGTGLAVPDGEPIPDISDADGLRSTLLQAASIPLPDPARATAGAHLVSVIQQLGVEDACMPLLAPFPSGAAAMRALAAASGNGVIGCAQSTEILETAGVRPAGGLPEPFQLSTVYTAGLTRDCQHEEASVAFIALLSGPRSEDERAAAGFEPV